MAVKKFTNEVNQKIWDSYYNSKLDDWSRENVEKLDEINKQKTSLAQYKPILLELDKYLYKPFDEITLNDYEEFKKQTTKKSKFVHVQGFFVYCISNGFVTIKDKDFITSLIPELYRPLISFLM